MFFVDSSEFYKSKFINILWHNPQAIPALFYSLQIFLCYLDFISFFRQHKKWAYIVFLDQFVKQFSQAKNPYAVLGEEKSEWTIINRDFID